MVDLVSLARRAKASQDGEAYAVLAKAPGYRLGIGARVARAGEPAFFVEVVLDPFPHRPGVDPNVLQNHAALLEQLRARGYVLMGDDAGCVTCERAMGRAGCTREIRTVGRVLVEALRKR
jgi:hypothetical protein